MKTQREIMWMAERFLPDVKEIYEKVKDEGCAGIRVDIGADGTTSLSFYNPMIVGYEELSARYDFKTGDFFDVCSQSVQAG